MKAAWTASLLCAVCLSGFAQAEGYLAGGTAPFSEHEKSILDEHAEILSLGINRDWLTASHIDTTLYLEALDVVANAVEAGSIPGAVIFADRRESNTMPTAVGWLMTDPQKHKNQWDSLYYVHDLTGAAVTVPLVYLALADGTLRLDSTVGETIAELADSPLGTITVEMLLRHSSGLPQNLPENLHIESDDEFWRALKSLALSAPGKKVVQSPANFLILGLMLERTRGVPLSTLFSDTVFSLFEWRLASMTPGASLRQLSAPDLYSDYLGRMAWNEPVEGFGVWLGENAGHVGLGGPAESFSLQAKTILMVMHAELKTRSFGIPSLLSPFWTTDPSLEDGGSMGLGLRTGRLGPHSFGWDSPMGSSFWILPEEDAFIVYLSNPSHPDGLRKDWQDPRAEVLPLLHRALMNGRRQADVLEQNEQDNDDDNQRSDPTAGPISPVATVGIRGQGAQQE